MVVMSRKRVAGLCREANVARSTPRVRIDDIGRRGNLVSTVCACIDSWLGHEVLRLSQTAFTCTPYTVKAEITTEYRQRVAESRVQGPALATTLARGG